MRGCILKRVIAIGLIGACCWGVGTPSSAQVSAQSAQSIVPSRAKNRPDTQTPETKRPDTQATNWRARRVALEADYKSDLDGIADWCRENGLEEHVARTIGLARDLDVGRQYIFLPSELAMPTPGPGVEGEWQTRLNAVNVKQGQRIFELARTAANQDAGAVAFQLLHEVIFYDRDQLAVRKILAHKKTKSGWRVAPEKFRNMPTRMAHDIVGWPARQYIRMRTTHFVIESSAGEARTRFLAEKLERWHAVWRQVFFEYWSSPAKVKRWIGGKGAVTDPRKRKPFRVVFFKNKSEYVNRLQTLVPGIARSTGYYVSSDRVSLFYDGNQQDQDTWRHELTHQLFRESGRSQMAAFETQFIWLDEGIAMYFETLADYGDYVTLGGFESRRLQWARIRRLLEESHVPMEQLSGVGRVVLQRQSTVDMVKFYTEAAGLTDMLMNDQSGAYEKRLIDFLTLIYKKRVKPGSFEKIIGKSYAELDAAYLEFLKVDPSLVVRHLGQPESLTILSMSGTEMDPAAFASIGRCVNLTKLDLSNNDVHKSDFDALKLCQSIEELILTRCRFEVGSLEGLAFFPALVELNLSGSSVQDSQLVGLEKLSRLRTLRLSGTAITDRGLMHLVDDSGLAELDVSGTQVTMQGIANLQRRLPKLKIVR